MRIREKKVRKQVMSQEKKRIEREITSTYRPGGSVVGRAAAQRDAYSLWHTVTVNTLLA